MFMLFRQCIGIVVQLLLVYRGYGNSVSLPTRYLCKTLLTDLLENPVSLVLIQPGKLYVAERDGKVVTVTLTDRGAAQPEVALDLSDKVLSKAERMGLLAITLHPRFHTNGHVFIMYSAATDDREFHHRQMISRFTLSSTNATEIDRFSELVILEIYQSAPTDGQIWFGSEDHMLYIAVGEGRRDRTRRFELTSFAGKILRINVDVDPSDGNVPYKIPEDNPFAHQPATLLPEVFAYGFQNPWRCSEDQRKEPKNSKGHTTPATRIVCVDLGSRFSDFNIIQKGGLYGWLGESFSPCRNLESCRNTSTKLKPEFKIPICRYPGMAVGGAFYLPWNAYLFADYLSGSLHYLRVTHSSPGSAWLRGAVSLDNATTCGGDQRSKARQTILNLQQTSDKELYVLTVSTDQTSDEPNGQLYRITQPRLNSHARPSRNQQNTLTATFTLDIFFALLTILTFIF